MHFFHFEIVMQRLLREKSNIVASFVGRQEFPEINEFKAWNMGKWRKIEKKPE